MATTTFRKTEDPSLLDVYLKRIKNIPIPARTQIASMSKPDLVNSHLRLVAHLARGIHRPDVHFMTTLELIQEGNIGLMHAAELFCPEKGYAFSTYATWWIRCYMMRALSNQENTIRISANVIETAFKAARKVTKEMAKLQKERLTTEELRSVLDPELYDAFITYRNISSNPMAAPSTTKLDQAVKSEYESLWDAENNIHEKELKKAIDRSLASLAPREEQILRLRFGANPEGTEHTFEEIGKILSVSKQRVEQIEKVALSKLRATPRKRPLSSLV